ncbi:hypothetical protein L9W92_02930 [Pelotomaculum terephthalicicum JT]|uniref:hypothetical protein n=1 Tax=Pelotomaculum terephthalicicum TaxID=206393 RepID=UPI001F04D32B|nr:hypothetical protein [Pelotomaculum terephthalicicum]MCG9967012.1 hypothetical protein [Pelotomaculum terephthalicicum JT]
MDGRNSGAPRGNCRLGLSQQGNDCSSTGYLHYFRGYSGAAYIGRVAVGAWERIWMEDHISSFWEGYFRRPVVPRCSGPRKKMPRVIYVGTFRKNHRIQESRKNTDDK